MTISRITSAVSRVKATYTINNIRKHITPTNIYGVSMMVVVHKYLYDEGVKNNAKLK